MKGRNVVRRSPVYGPSPTQGSELFVVYTEEQDTDPLMPDRFSELRNRGFVVKINRLFRY